MAEERRESVILDFEVDEGASIESISNLTKANKALRDERNKLNLQSVEGKKRLSEINATLDQNTNKIKSNVSALEKQKINIGNYRGELDKIHPALGKVSTGLEGGTKGIMGMVRASLAFIATPLGAALAAIVAVFTLLKAALYQNDALMDKFENVTNAVGVVLEIVVARVGKLGEALIALASGNFSEAINKTSQAFSGLAEEIGNAVTQQQIYLTASRDLEDSQRNLRIQIARETNEITKLIKESKNRNLTLDESAALLDKAAAKEENLQRTKEDVARRDLLITARQLRSAKEFQQTSNETFDEYVKRLLESSALGDDEKNKLTEKVVALEEARNSGLVLQQKIENDLSAIQDKRTEAIKKQTIAAAELAAQQAADRRAASEEVRSSKDGVVRQDRENPLQGAFDTQLNKKQELDITERFNKRIVDAESEADAEIRRNKERSARAQIETQQRIKEQTLGAASDIAGGIAGLLNEQGQAYKLAASAQVIISTYASAQKAYEAAFLPIPTVASPGLGVAFAAAAILKGIANLAAINGVQFAEGGWTGPGNKWQAVGVVHADEYVTPKRVKNLPQAQPHIAALEQMRIRGFADGGLVTNMSSFPINQQFEMANIFKNLPPAEVSVVEFNKVNRRVKVKEALSKR